MHELSIARQVVEIASQHATNSGSDRITRITLRIGRLSCVHQDALRFCFDLVAEGTAAEGATLEVVDVPVVIFCPTCGDTAELPDIQRFRCPNCHTPSSDIRQGRELDIDTIELAGSPEPGPAAT